MKHRVAGIIIKGEEILLMRRLKNGREYYVFPGGGVEEGESLEEALKREIKEETSLNAGNTSLLFEQENQHYFLLEDFSGNAELGGPEKERMSIQNQYFLEWVEIAGTHKLEEMDNLFPREAVTRLVELLQARR